MRSVENEEGFTGESSALDNDNTLWCGNTLSKRHERHLEPEVPSPPSRLATGTRLSHRKATKDCRDSRDRVFRSAFHTSVASLYFGTTTGSILNSCSGGAVISLTPARASGAPHSSVLIWLSGWHRILRHAGTNAAKPMQFAAVPVKTGHISILFHGWLPASVERVLYHRLYHMHAFVTSWAIWGKAPAMLSFAKAPFGIVAGKVPLANGKVLRRPRSECIWQAV